MSNETDLDWLARNVHVWDGNFGFIVMLKMKNGDNLYMHTRDGSKYHPYCMWNAVLNAKPYSKAQWLARRAELQNKPSWKDAPEWAEWLAQDAAADGTGAWWWYRTMPIKGERTWSSKGESSRPTQERGEVLGDWRDTLERRQESPERFKPITSIEDNQEQGMTQQATTQQAEKQQDNNWFERGELPPVGVECEVRVADRWNPCFMIGFNRKGNSVIEYGSAIVEVDNCEFRPIRTGRELAIEEMCQVAGVDGLMFGLVAAKLYDAGYRKDPK